MTTLGLILVGFNRQALIKQGIFTLSSYLFVAVEYIPFPQWASGPFALVEGSVNAARGEVGNDSRWEIWADLIDIWSDSPWFGIGFGQFPSNSLLGLTAHSTPLSFLVEAGILFTLLTVAMFFAVVARGLAHKGLSRMIATFVLGMAVFGLGNDVHNIATFWIVVGLGAALSASAPRGVSST